MDIESPSAAWGAEFSVDADGHRIIRLSKGHLWVETMGGRDADKEVLYQRAIIEALKMDLARARSEEEKRFVDSQLRHAVKDEEVSMQLRLDVVRERILHQIAEEAATAGKMT